MNPSTELLQIVKKEKTMPRCGSKFCATIWWQIRNYLFLISLKFYSNYA